MRRQHGPAVDQLLAEESDAGVARWYLTDNLGTVRDLVDNSGSPVSGGHFQYDAFGNVTSGTTTLTRYLYTSRERDSETGLQYNRARWYDAATGRWLSEDPIGFMAGDTNLMRFVGNSPTNLRDPSGLDPSDAVIAATVRARQAELRNIFKEVERLGQMFEEGAPESALFRQYDYITELHDQYRRAIFDLGRMIRRDNERRWFLPSPCVDEIGTGWGNMPYYIQGLDPITPEQFAAMAESAEGLGQSYRDLDGRTGVAETTLEYTGYATDAIGLIGGVGAIATTAKAIAKAEGKIAARKFLMKEAVKFGGSQVAAHAGAAIAARYGIDPNYIRYSMAAFQLVSMLRLEAVFRNTTGKFRTVKVQCDGANSPVSRRAYDISTRRLNPKEKAHVEELARRTNEWLKETGPATIKPTKGKMRSEANAAARRERIRAEQAGQPYQGHAGHVPDTAISGQPNPPAGWLDMEPMANSTAGGGLSKMIGQTIDIVTIDGKVP